MNRQHVLQWLLVGTLLVGAQAVHAQMLGLSEGEGPGRPQAAGTRATFVCLASDGRTGTVYGTDVYTAESAVCAAAVHAGVLPPFQAGAVTIVFGSGARSFQGSARNGVTTRDYGPWQYSYTFARDGEPGTISWRTVWNKVPEDFTEPVAVQCPPRGGLDGPLWGTDVYTRDSVICVAAVHAGAITAERGGIAVVRRVPGLREYPATERFGVTSQAYGPYREAFTVTAARALVSDARPPAAASSSVPSPAPTVNQTTSGPTMARDTVATRSRVGAVGATPEAPLEAAVVPNASASIPRPAPISTTTGTVATVTPGAVVPQQGGSVMSSSEINETSALSPVQSADLETVVSTASTVGAGTNWTRHGTARYVVRVTNRGPRDANSVALSVPPSSGLAKQGVICSAAGASCPPGLTTTGLEAGVSLSTIPAGGTITVSFFAHVTAQAGTTVTAAATVSALTPDVNPANNSSTQSHFVDASTTADPSMHLETRIEPDPRATTYWQPNSTARYRATIALYGIPSLSPTTTADGAVIAVPAAENLSKTSVTCTATGGAYCPATVTVAQLESGVVVPRLPDGGTLTFAFSATVTGPLGGSVTVRSVAAPPIGHTTPNASLLNSAKTQSILVPSGSSVGDALAVLPASTPSPLTTTPTPASCDRPGPVIEPPTVTFNSLSFRWPHINGASYTVTHAGEVLTPTPITSAVYPATLTFSRSAPFNQHTTYVYTVTAQYEDVGCGESQVSFVGPPAWVPLITSYSATAPGTNPRSATFGWRLPDALTNEPYRTCPVPSFTPCSTWRPPAGDNSGFLVLGPGLPSNGYEIWGCTTSPTREALDFGDVTHPLFTSTAPTREDCLGYIPEVYLPQWAITVPVSPGTHTWTVVPYWDTPNGRRADVSSGAPVTVTVL